MFAGDTFGLMANANIKKIMYVLITPAVCTWYEFSEVLLSENNDVSCKLETTCSEIVHHNLIVSLSLMLVKIMSNYLVFNVYQLSH